MSAKKSKNKKSKSKEIVPVKRHAYARGAYGRNARGPTTCELFAKVMYAIVWVPIGTIPILVRAGVESLKKTIKK